MALISLRRCLQCANRASRSRVLRSRNQHKKRTAMKNLNANIQGLKAGIQEIRKDLQNIEEARKLEIKMIEEILFVQKNSDIAELAQLRSEIDRLAQLRNEISANNRNFNINQNNVTNSAVKYCRGENVHGKGRSK